MTTFYTLGARLSGMAALVCAVLAVLSHPSIARADEPDCGLWCASLYDPGTQYEEYMKCYSDCVASIQGGKCGGNSCSKDCVDKGSMGNCGGKLCNSGGGCWNCKCTQIDEIDENCTCRDK